MLVRATSARPFASFPTTALLHKPEARSAALKVLLALSFPLGGPMFHAGSYVLLAAWALSGSPRRAIEALTLSWLITYLNPDIYVLSNGAELLRWLVIGCAFLTVMVCAVKRLSSMPKALPWVVGFVLLAGLSSLQESYAPDVSLFKLASFLIASTTVLLAFHLTKSLADYWETWFLILFAMIVLLSFPLIVHDLGYVRNGRGFQGLINHPQAYGTFIAPFLAWLFALCFAGSMRGKLPWLLAGVGTVSLFATQSRTAAFAAVAALTIAMLWPSLRGPSALTTMNRFLPWIFPLFGVVLSVILLNGVQVAQSIEHFAKKGSVDTEIDDAFYRSRGMIIEQSLENFRQHPWMGIGFGVASDPSTFNVQRDPYFGLPVGASVEKGFAVAAVLEEVGVIGFGAFVILVYSLLRSAFSARIGLPTAALALGSLFVNFGESVFFAVGGTGLLVWLLLGAAGVMGRSKVRCRTSSSGKIYRPFIRRRSSAM